MEPVCSIIFVYYSITVKINLSLSLSLSFSLISQNLTNIWKLKKQFE